MAITEIEVIPLATSTETLTTHPLDKGLKYAAVCRQGRVYAIFVNKSTAQEHVNSKMLVGATVRELAD